MLERIGRKVAGFALGVFVTVVATGCSSSPPAAVGEEDESNAVPAGEGQRLGDTTRQRGDRKRVAEPERQPTDRQRHCAEEKRRLEVALKETQARLESAQKKLDAVLAIDRDMRANKGR